MYKVFPLELRRICTLHVANQCDMRLDERVLCYKACSIRHLSRIWILWQLESIFPPDSEMCHHNPTMFLAPPAVTGFPTESAAESQSPQLQSKRAGNTSLLSSSQSQWRSFWSEEVPCHHPCSFSAFAQCWGRVLIAHPDKLLRHQSAVCWNTMNIQICNRSLKDLTSGEATI